MKILIGIPVLYNGSVCLSAFKSVINEADLLIIDNNSESDVKEAIKQISSEHPNKVWMLENEKNIFVTASWNVMLKCFLANDSYDYLVIMNSDLIMRPGWSNYLEENVWCIPNTGNYTTDTEVFEGIAGIFINFNKEMARLVYPLPEQLKIWYSDAYIEYKFRKHGYKMIVKAGLTAEHVHGGSITVKRLPEFHEIIEQDLIEWEKIKPTI